MVDFRLFAAAPPEALPIDGLPIDGLLLDAPLVDAPAKLAVRTLPRPRGNRPTRSVELDLWRQGLQRVAGIDEVGRGALAGPVVSAAVTLAPNARPAWLRDVRDSKALTPRQRSRLAPLIKASVADWGVGWATRDEIDRHGIVPATRLSMQRAVAALRDVPEFVLVDGTDRHDFPCGFEAIKKGDARVTSIAAASVVAKVARDAWMEAISGRNPTFNFASNKGYSSAAHLRSLADQGPCSEHRRSFAPVREAAGDAPRELSLPFDC
jgi:ribonuclease HII